MGFVDLPPLTQLRVENAYFKEGSPRKLDDYIGTQIAHIQVEPRRGLRVLNLESALGAIPKDQAPASDLVGVPMRRFRNYRYYYAVVFAKAGRGAVGSAVLLGANSAVEMERLGEQLEAEPDSVCGGPAAKNCTVFPQTCSVSLEMEITVNGSPRVVGWRATLGGLAPPAGKAMRLTRGGTVTELPGGDIRTRATVLLPGDRVAWE